MERLAVSLDHDKPFACTDSCGCGEQGETAEQLELQRLRNLLRASKVFAETMVHAARFQQHSPDCAVNGVLQPRRPFSDDDDVRGRPGPCNCWRRRFAEAYESLVAERTVP